MICRVLTLDTKDFNWYNAIRKGSSRRKKRDLVNILKKFLLAISEMTRLCVCRRSLSLGRLLCWDHNGTEVIFYGIR